MHEIKEINGKMYRVFPNGSKLVYTPPNPALEHIPNLSGIYCITQISTGKKYIGSSMRLKDRLTQYFKGKQPNREISKVSTLDMKFEVLELMEQATRGKLLIRELYHILKLNTVSPNGYNKQNPVNKTHIKENRDFKTLNTDIPKKIKHIFKPQPQTKKHIVDILVKYKG